MSCFKKQAISKSICLFLSSRSCFSSINAYLSFTFPSYIALTLLQLSAACFFFSAIVCFPWLKALLRCSVNPRSSSWLSLILDIIAFLIWSSSRLMFLIIISLLFCYLNLFDLSFITFYYRSQSDFSLFSCVSQLSSSSLCAARAYFSVSSQAHSVLSLSVSSLILPAFYDFVCYYEDRICSMRASSFILLSFCCMGKSVFLLLLFLPNNSHNLSASTCTVTNFSSTCALCSSFLSISIELS